jgi:hypothetical protein
MRITSINTNHPNMYFDPYLDRIKFKFTKIWRVVIDYEAAFVNGYAETSAPNAVFDGTAVAAKVWVVSNDAKDTGAGVGVQQVTLLGIGATGLFQSEVVTLAGATDVETANTWQRIFHMYASRWGTELDAAGTIICESDNVATATYLTIAAGANESDGAAIWVPSGYYYQMQKMSLVLLTRGAETTALLAKIDYNNFDGSGTDPDLTYFQIRATVGCNSERASRGQFRYADGLSKVTLYNTYIGAAETGHLRVTSYILGA